MRKGKIAARILGIALLCLMIGSMLGGLPDSVDARIGEDSSSPNDMLDTILSSGMATQDNIAISGIVGAGPSPSLSQIGVVPSLERSKTFGGEDTDYGLAGPDFDGVQGLIPGSEPATWVQTNGPSGGIINTIEIDPAHPDILYAGGAGGGVFKTTDGGTAWTMLEQIVSPSEHIHDILLSPDDPQTLYALAGWLYKSTNGGESWRIPDQEYRFSCVAMDPANSSALIGGTWDGHVYHSADGGESWTEITSNLPGDHIADVAIGASNEFWAGTANSSDGRLYHTTNGGVSWDEEDFDKPPETDLNNIFVDPEDADIVYVSLGNVHNVGAGPGESYLFKTENGGNTWIPLYLPGGAGLIAIMGRAPTDDMLYVCDGFHVYKSNDDENWTYIGPPGQNGDMYDIAVDPRDSDVLYLPRRAHGIFKSENGGGDGGASWANWELINEGLPNVSISLLAVPNVPGSGTVYATAVSGEGTFKTTDWGNSWTHVNEEGDQITHPWADELVVSPHDPLTVWEVADVSEVFQTTNGGTTWSKIINPYGHGFRFASVYAMALAPSDSDTIYALKNGFGIFKSTDGGRSWRFLHQSEVDYTYSIVVHPINPDIVYSGYSPKPFQDWAMVRQTTDGGDSWRTALTVPHSSGITSVAIDPNDPDTVYAGSTGEEGEIYVSYDNGETWSKLNDELTFTTVMRQNQLQVDPNNKNTIYAATWGGGTYKSIDGGENWVKLENAPESSMGLAIYEGNPNIIYACDRSQPVIHKSEDGGQTWREYYRFGMPSILTSAVAIDPNDSDTIYAATFGLPFCVMTGSLVKITNGTKVADLDESLPGPSEGVSASVIDIEVDPNDSNTIYVTKHGYGVFKTMDGGASWVRLDDQGTGLPRIGYYDIDMDYSDSNTLYATGLCELLPEYIIGPTGLPQNIEPDSGGVYKSTDGGYNWTRILETETANRAVEIDPQDPNVLYVASRTEGILVSSDGGQNWSRQNEGLPTLGATSVVAKDGYIYAGIEGSGVYAGVVNDDYSITWDKARSNKPKAYVSKIQIAVDPMNSSQIYASGYPGGMLKSYDGGKHWYDKNTSQPTIIVDDPNRQGYYAFDIDPNNPADIWMGIYGKGLYRSHEYMEVCMFANGDNHEMVNKPITDLLIDPTDSNTIYVATEEGMFVTRDDGKSWSEMNDGLDTPQIRTLAITADGTLLCGTPGYELYYYDSSDNRWQQMNAFGSFGTLWPIWDDRPLYQYTSLLFHPTDPDIIYFGTFPAGIYKSTDGGLSWRESNVGWTNDGVFSLVFHPENPDIIYAGTYNGVNRSTDGGAHWEMWDQGWPDEQWVFSIDFDPRDPNVMYACSKNGENEGNGREDFHGTVMKSINGGATWLPICDGLDVNQEFYKIIVDKGDPDKLYLATQGDGVFISCDGGAVWVPWNEGLTNPVAGTNGNNVTNTLVLSADGGYLYFGTAGSGVFRRSTEGGVSASPTVTTNYATDVGTTGARLNGNLDSLGTASSVDVRFQWGTSSGDYPNETASQPMDATGAFNFDLLSLNPGTTYYFRGKAVGDGTSYGDEKSFTTVSPPSDEDNPDVATGLASLENELVIAYGYKAGEGIGGWTVYNPEWAVVHPGWNTLTTLYMGRGYWLDVSGACSLEYGSQVYGLEEGWNLIGWVGW